MMLCACYLVFKANLAMVWKYTILEMRREIIVVLCVVLMLPARMQVVELGSEEFVEVTTSLAFEPEFIDEGLEGDQGGF